LAINGGVVDTGVNAGTPSAGAAAYVEIGADSDEDGTTSLNADVYLDQYFALDGCILPYGDIFKGNGAVDTAVADKSILSYWDGSDCTSTNIAIGGKTLTQTNGAFITSGGLGNVDDYYDAQGQASSLEVAIAASDVFNITQGMMSMWFNVQTTSSYRVLFGVGVDSDNYMQLSDYFPAAGLYTLTFTTRWGGSTAYTGPSGQISIGTWHYAQCLWNTISKQVAFILDGQLIETETHGGTWAGTPLSYFIGANYLGNDGCDAFYDEFHIADIPYPPQNWSAMGVPLHVPLIEVA